MEQLTEEEINTLFEAARWSPSCYNEQPWRFVYATKPEARERLLSVLAQSNREWANRAPLIVIAFSHMIFNSTQAPNRWAAFDTGAAWMSFALQAQHMGLATHAMGGFDEDMVYQLTGVDPSEFVAMAVIAVGRHGDPSSLPAPLRNQEKPNDRMGLSNIVYEFRTDQENDATEDDLPMVDSEE